MDGLADCGSTKRIGGHRHDALRMDVANRSRGARRESCPIRASIVQTCAGCNEQQRQAGARNARAHARQASRHTAIRHLKRGDSSIEGTIDSYEDDSIGLGGNRQGPNTLAGTAQPGNPIEAIRPLENPRFGLIWEAMNPGSDPCD
jgi:hypothetical protein